MLITINIRHYLSHTSYTYPLAPSKAPSFSPRSVPEPPGIAKTICLSTSQVSFGSSSCFDQSYQGSFFRFS